MINHLIDRVLNSDGIPLPEDMQPHRALCEPVVSIPSPLRGPLNARIPGLLTTEQVFRRLLGSAQRSLKIFSPPRGQLLHGHGPGRASAHGA